MNDKKIAFIICSHMPVYLEECLHYIAHLEVPDGYEIETLSIQDATSITSAYNEAMQASDAKYKVYLHHDVFIINKKFIQNMLDIFAEDEKIGLLGLVGYQSLNAAGIMWKEERYGMGPLYGAQKAYPRATTQIYQYDIRKGGYQDVAVVDGLLLATSTDIPWDEEDLKGWDFYDAYQSMRFQEAGYRVVVPKQTLPWVVHDDGHILTMWEYDVYRQKFMHRFHDALGKEYTEIRKNAKID